MVSEGVVSWVSRASLVGGDCESFMQNILGQIDDENDISHDSDIERLR